MKIKAINWVHQTSYKLKTMHWIPWKQISPPLLCVLWQTAEVVNNFIYFFWITVNNFSELELEINTCRIHRILLQSSTLLLSQRWGSHSVESYSMVKEVLQVSKVQDPHFRRGVWMRRAIEASSHLILSYSFNLALMWYN